MNTLELTEFIVVPRICGVGIYLYQSIFHSRILQRLFCPNNQKVSTLYFSVFQVAAKVLVLNTGPISGQSKIWCMALSKLTF